MLQETRIDVRILESSAPRTYPIVIGAGTLGRLGQIVEMTHFSRVVLVADPAVKSHAERLRAALPMVSEILFTESGEAAKSTAVLDQLWISFQRFGLDRRSLVINVGGGAIGDLGGFAASTFMRGIQFIQVPTTLLAQVDASIGGKLAINVAGVKNLVGSFMQPSAVIIDTETLATLPGREFRAGFAEILKHGLIADRRYFERARDVAKQLRLGGTTFESPIGSAHTPLSELIHGSCVIKARVVESDETERGPRKVLNFGHTFGHALESISHRSTQPLLHGEAVALGMLAEAALSKLKGFISAADVAEIRESIQSCGLPTVRALSEESRQAVLKEIVSDKKNVGGKIRWSLLRTIGEASYDIEAAPHEMHAALSEIASEAAR